MRYLKTFNESSSSQQVDEIRNYIKDILLDLQDIGFSVVINHIHTHRRELGTPPEYRLGTNALKVIISSLKSAYLEHKEEYEGVRSHLIDWAKSCGCKYEVDNSRGAVHGSGSRWTEVIWLTLPREFSEVKESNSALEKEEYIKDILLDLKESGFQIGMSMANQDSLEIYIKKSGDIFYWGEVKDSIIRLIEWYYEWSGNQHTPGINYKISNELSKLGIRYKSTSPFRMFNSGIEFGIGWHCEDDFKHLDDDIAFTNIRLLIRL